MPESARGQHYFKVQARRDTGTGPVLGASRTDWVTGVWQGVEPQVPGAVHAQAPPPQPPPHQKPRPPPA